MLLSFFLFFSQLFFILIPDMFYNDRERVLESEPSKSKSQVPTSDLGTLLTPLSLHFLTCKMCVILSLPQDCVRTK